MVCLLVLSNNVLIRANEEKPRETRKSYGARGIKCAGSRPYIVRRADVILTVAEEVSMIRANAHRFGAIRTLVLVGFFPIGLLTSTAVPALAGSSGTWAITGSMNTARDGGTATLLSNGQVLVAGGFGAMLNTFSSAKLYDPPLRPHGGVARDPPSARVGRS